MSKTKQGECCKDLSNKVLRTKTATYKETICKKCGYIYETHDIKIK